MINQTILHYKILGRLGEGGMGVVYKAEDTKLKRDVAIKFLPHRIAIDDEKRERFRIEAQAAAALNHPNISTIYAIEETEDEIFIVMEHIQGKELREMVETHNHPALPFEKIIAYATQIAEGLRAAHEKGVIHRDIKPSNIMITKKEQVKIMDFGLAKLPGGTRITKAGSALGTAAYMSPEQVTGQEADERSDIWSFGVVLYEMLAGKLPFAGEYEQVLIYSILHDEPSLEFAIPSEFRQIVQRALSKNPEDRYSSITELLEELNKYKDFRKPDGTIAKSSASIVVLPFINLSSEKENEYFSDGMTEELINGLAKIKDLHVVSRTSAFAFKGKGQDIRQVGRRLNVNHVLEGSVRKSGSRLRITAKLTKVSDGYHLWSEKYDRELQDLFEIQDEISANIVQVLKVILTVRERVALEQISTHNVEAYDFYLRGRQYLNEFTKKSIDYAQEMFLKATGIDPNYALAYTGIADCCTWRYQWWNRNKSNLDEAIITSRRALDIDSKLAEAHVAFGWAISLDHNYVEAATAFETAISLNPILFEAYYLYARSCFAEGNALKAAGLFEKAHAVRPDDYQAISLLDVTYKKAGMKEKAVEAARRAFVSIEHRLQLNPDDTRAVCLGANALMTFGETAKALEWADRALANDKEGGGTRYNVACVLAKADRIEEAIDCVEEAIKSGSLHREWLESDPDMDPLREHPRFRSLMEELRQSLQAHF